MFFQWFSVMLQLQKWKAMRILYKVITTSMGSIVASLFIFVTLVLAV